MPLFILIILAPQVVHAFSFSKLFSSFQEVGSSIASAGEIEGAIHDVNKTPALQAARNADPNPAKGGGEITIAGGMVLVPEIGPSGTRADIEVARPGQDQISIYVVREGDTLSQIAELFNVSTNTLVWSNDLGRGNVIRPGETLVILPVSGVRHTVEKGDTLAKIIKRYEGDTEEVLEFNGLTEGSTLTVGDVVVVPYGVMPQATRSTVSTSAVAQGSGGPQLDGYFLRPVVGGIRTQGVHGYNGVDIAAAVGTPVLASASGEVIISRSYGYNGGYGQYIVIRHNNGTQTLYAHLSENKVFAGAQVVQGQVIGAIGNTGRSTGPHVHFEVRGARNPF